MQGPESDFRCQFLTVIKRVKDVPSAPWNLYKISMHLVSENNLKQSCLPLSTGPDS